MKNIFIKIIHIYIIFCFVISYPFQTVVYAFETETSNDQIVNIGGENNAAWNTDGVYVSKTIEGTNNKDVFDITLKIKLKESIEQILDGESVDIVLLMDLSNSMLYNIDGEKASGNSAVPLGEGNTKAELTISAAKNFINDFYSKSLTYIDDSIGIVGFNTSGVEIVPLTVLDSQSTVNTINESMENSILSLLSTYSSSDIRKNTNIEAGLKMAKDMLKDATGKYKYIVLISDGLPTTYVPTDEPTDYSGINPNTMEDNVLKGLFSNESYYKTNNGTYYSDTGALRARHVAEELKENGVNIYSIGVGLNTFKGSSSSNTSYPFAYNNQKSLNGQQLIINQLSRSVIARHTTTQNDSDYTWDLGGNLTSTISGRNAIWNNNEENIYNLQWEICRIYDESTNTYNYLPLNTNVSLFENWLKYSIGSGYYYDASTNEEVQEGIDDILVTINNASVTRKPEVWTTIDTVTSGNTTTSNFIDFLGFYSKSGELVQSLAGENTLNAENSAIIESGENYDTIHWDVKKSGYIIEQESMNNVYVYTLKYRVKLDVNDKNFVNKKPYDTNGDATLTYVIKDSQNEISALKTIEYPIPRVNGEIINPKTGEDKNILFTIYILFILSLFVVYRFNKKENFSL